MNDKTAQKISRKLGGEVVAGPEGITGWTVHINHRDIKDIIEFLEKKGVGRNAARFAVETAYLIGQRDGWEVATEKETNTASFEEAEEKITKYQNQGHSQNRAIELAVEDFWSVGRSYSRNTYFTQRRESKKK